MKKTLILSTKPPYGSAINAEGFRAALGLAFSELHVDIVLMCDGVYAAATGQAPEALEMKSMAEAYAGAGELGINVFLDADSVKHRNLGPDRLIDVPQLSAAEVAAKIDEADAVLTF